MIYISIIIILLFLIVYYDFGNKEHNKIYWFFFMLIVFILVAGLRYRLGIDTTRYIDRFYNRIPDLWNLTREDFLFGSDPLFTILMSTVHSLDGHFYHLQLIQAIIVNSLVFFYIKKHTQYIFVSLFFYFIWMYTAFNMEEMRASISVSICLFANDFILERKWLKAIMLYFIGALFHSSAIVIALSSVFLLLRVNYMGAGFLVISVFLLGGTLSLTEQYLELFDFNDAVSDKIDKYTENESMVGGRVSLSSFVIKIYCCSLVFFCLHFVKKRHMKSDLLKLEPLLTLFVLFSLVSVEIFIAYRFVRFYSIYYIIFMSHFVIYLFKQRYKLIACLVMAPVIFLYMTKDYFKETTWARYYPYSSVIEKNIDNKREQIYSSFNGYPVFYGEY